MTRLELPYLVISDGELSFGQGRTQLFRLTGGRLQCDLGM